MKDEFRLQVRMFNPPNLLATFSLAKIQDGHVNMEKRSLKGSGYSGTNAGSAIDGVSHAQGYELSKQTSKALVPI